MHKSYDMPDFRRRGYEASQMLDDQWLSMSHFMGHDASRLLKISYVTLLLSSTRLSAQNWVPFV